MDRFYAVFQLTHLQLRDSILNFPDNVRRARKSRGLKTWDLNHRAGLAPQERAPRPSKKEVQHCLVLRSELARALLRVQE